MSITNSVPQGNTVDVSSQSDLGTGSLQSLVSEGFVSGTIGFDSASYTADFEIGDVIYVVATGDYFEIKAGSGGRCAVLMASSAGSGTIQFTDEFHVDQDFGDDATADGTEARPFQTIQALMNMIDRQFEFRADLTCRATGAGGNFFAQGVLTQYGALATLDMPMTNTAVSGAVNTTTAQALTVTLQWGTADPGNTATLTNLTIQG